MNSLKKKLLSLLILALLTFILGRFVLGPEGKEEVPAKKGVVEKSSIQKTRSDDNLKTTAQIKKSADANQKAVSESSSLEELKDLERQAQERSKECDQAVQEYLPDEGLVDLEDPFYSDPAQVISRILNIINESLKRDVAAEGYNKLKSAVREGDIKDVPMIHQFMASFDQVCRHVKALNFVDTAVDASSYHNWSKESQKELLNILLSGLDDMMKDMYSMANIEFVSNILGQLIDNGLISPHYRGEMEGLIERVFYQDGLFHEDLSAGVSTERIIDYFDNQDDFGRELKDIIARIKSNL